MTDRERRQRRLLQVRTLQADLAAASLRRLRSEHDVDLQQLQSLVHTQHTVVLCSGVAGTGEDWLVSCAERELAGLHASRLIDQIEERVPRLHAEAATEQRCRQDREQIQRLCDRTAALAKEAQERNDQAILDDLYSAVRSRPARSRSDTAGS